MFKSFICTVLSAILTFSFSIFSSEKVRTIGVNKYKTYQVFEDFGTSSCWWAQTIDSEERADEIARLLYDRETGLGLKVFRYNIGGGEKDNPDSRIGDVTRRTESFYVLNEETGEYEYDFTRDANARRMLDKAVEYGAEKVILFCNSPHFSMTASGHASGGLESYSSNLPEENYGKFVDYVLTIADWFVSQGYPVDAISPINEPQWSWGGEWVGQEGCHYTVDETIKLLEMFATEMQKRNSPYTLKGPESGQLTWQYYEYIDKFFESEILNGYCEYYSAHSYWMDNDLAGKDNFGAKMAQEHPGKKFEMSEWCELPLKIDSTTIDSGLYMANIIMQDITRMNAVSWQSWTAVNGDGLLDIKDGELVKYNRYYAFGQFTKYIESGMTRIQVLDSKENNENLDYCAFKGNGKTVLVMINNGEAEKNFRLRGLYFSEEIIRTDADHNCESIYSGKFVKDTTLPSKSITTIVLGG